MRKRKLFGLCGITVLVLAGGLTALAATVKHEPSFYRQSQAPPSKERTELAYTFVRHFGQMMQDRGRKEIWGCNATEAEMNSFFAEMLMQQGEAEGLRNLGISGPSVFLEQDHLRLGFRYGSGWFSTIISYELKVWLVPKEANVIAVEVLRARAGALPISNQSILQQLSEFARKQNYRVTLYRHEGNSVAIIDLQGDQQQPKNILTALTIAPNLLSIRGRTLEHGLTPLDPAKEAKIIATRKE
jgi:hypothetical protein